MFAGGDLCGTGDHRMFVVVSFPGRPGILHQNPLAAGRDQIFLECRDSANGANPGLFREYHLEQLWRKYLGQPQVLAEGVLVGLSTPRIESGVKRLCSGSFIKLATSSGANGSGSSVSLAASCCGVYCKSVAVIPAIEQLVLGLR